jgi:hypothetical protein
VAQATESTLTLRPVRLDSSAAPTTLIISDAVAKFVSIVVPVPTERKNSWISAVNASAQPVPTPARAVLPRR